MKLISGIIIAKNAQDIISDALSSLSFCDEIIVVDNNSTDETVKTAKSFGARVVKGIDGDFAKSRNIGLESAEGKWVLYIDSDERIDSVLQTSILKAVATDTYTHYSLKRKNFYLGKNPWPKIESFQRLFLRSKIKKWDGKLHETPIVEGKSGLLDGYLLHYTHRDLESMLDKTIAWSAIEAQLRFDTNHPRIVIWRLIRVMITGFWNSYITQGGWKAGTMGFIESMYQSYSMFVTYARLWEMQQKHEN